MKSPRPKIHLLDVSEPLLAYHEIEMRCGVVLKNAQPKFMFSHDVRHEVSLPLGLCRKCMEKAPVISDDPYYHYGLVEAEEEKQFHEDIEGELVA